MSNEIGGGTSEDPSLEKLRTLQVTDLEELRTLQITPIDVEEDDESQINGDGDTFDDEDEDEYEEQVPVTLGFVEKPRNRWSLLRQLFPSTAGGVPVRLKAWLDPINLPSGRSCHCEICGEPLQFLLQLWCDDSFSFQLIREGCVKPSFPPLLCITSLSVVRCGVMRCLMPIYECLS
ncbi:hypothetical protein CsSME_00047412 [Camellia sinensis var. sinensis]